MNNIFVYIEIETGKIADVSLELLTKARSLADTIGCKVEAIAIGSQIKGIEKQLEHYGADILHIADDLELEPYRTLPHAAIVCGVFEKEKPQIALFGASSIGRDLGPRVSAALHSGLTADCTALEIGDHTDNKTQKKYENLLYQIRPAFGGNIIATIINPDCRPQMATVREGVMKMQKNEINRKIEVKNIDHLKYIKNSDLAVKILAREIETKKINIKGANIVVAGGYGMGSKEGFDMLFSLAETIGAEVGASRAAIDSGMTHNERQIGQTGVTVRPKLYIACGISGQIQHTAGMDEAATIIAINSDPEAPIHKLADYSIVGNVHEVVPKMIKYYKENSK